jgi:SAM-dependent methyltransferase
MNNALQNILQKIKAHSTKQELLKIVLGNKRNVAATLKTIIVKPALIKRVLQLSFTYRYNTKDEVKNFTTDEAIVQLENLLQTEFYNADVFTIVANYHFVANKKDNAKLVTKPATIVAMQDMAHDKIKHRIAPAAAPYLQALGITTAEGVVKKDMQDKYKQINHYIEIIDGILKNTDLPATITVVDMGSGKGYLTFALYHYLHHTLQRTAKVYGVELRPDMVQLCNSSAAKQGFAQLQFIEGSIQNAAIPNADVLIALHACDTATDDAIYRGISTNAKIIICAPCCHKQIRKEMAPDNELQSITKHGILLERQAEMVTDTIRALLLDAHDYKTKVFEFIDTAHTPKNVMITAVKTTKPATTKQQSMQSVAGLKKLFNIKSHYLETLLFNK